MLKNLLIAASAAAACIMPVAAEVQPGTSSLLRTIEESGILVTFNHPDCATNGTHGSYRWVGLAREMRLCPGDTIDPLDHNTVRHETIHAIQHCVNAARGTDEHTPIVTDEAQYTHFVNENLSQQEIERIKELYKESDWLVEFEAFAGARAFTASELEELFLEVCVAPETGI